MHNLLILTRHAEAYRRLVEAAQLPDLAIVRAIGATDLLPVAERSDVVLGEPSLIRDALPRLPALQWAQSTWAGVEPLLDPIAAPRLRVDQRAGRVRPADVGGLFGYLIAPSG